MASKGMSIPFTMADTVEPRCQVVEFNGGKVLLTTGQNVQEVQDFLDEEPDVVLSACSDEIRVLSRALKEDAPGKCPVSRLRRTKSFWDEVGIGQPEWLSISPRNPTERSERLRLTVPQKWPS